MIQNGEYLIVIYMMKLYHILYTKYTFFICNFSVILYHLPFFACPTLYITPQTFIAYMYLISQPSTYTVSQTGAVSIVDLYRTLHGCGINRRPIPYPRRVRYQPSTYMPCGVGVSPINPGNKDFEINSVLISI